MLTSETLKGVLRAQSGFGGDAARAQRHAEEVSDGIAACLAAWVVRTGAASVRIQLSPSAECSDDLGEKIVFNTVDEDNDDPELVQWEDLECLAETLAAPCSRLGLDCRLEQSADACGPALVMCRRQ